MDSFEMALVCIGVRVATYTETVLKPRRGENASSRQSRRGRHVRIERRSVRLEFSRAEGVERGNEEENGKCSVLDCPAYRSCVWANYKIRMC